MSFSISNLPIGIRSWAIWRPSPAAATSSCRTGKQRIPANSRGWERCYWRGGPVANIWFCGDPHGRFRHIIDSVKKHRPAVIILLGDIQATKPLQDELAEILSLTAIYWIAGNHDTGTVSDYDHLFGSALRDRNLHGRVVDVAGVRIAGLGGIFRERVWMPPAEPIYGSAKEFMRIGGKGNRWRGGLPLRHRSTIFADDYHRLARMTADVLVVHGAPGEHPQGNEAYEYLAVTMGVRKLFHGHTHDSLPYRLQAIQMFGVGLRGIANLDGTKIVPGELDEARAYRGNR
jgi:predicted phosphodiesterase